MDPQACIKILNETKEYFDRSTKVLGEDDAAFAPADGAMTTAQQVAHVAQTVDWFMEGAFRPEGFDLDFESHAKQIAAIETLAQAREWLDRAFAAAVEATAEKTAEDLAQPMAEGMVMGGLPRYEIYAGIADHTAHHRGVLTVHSRMRGHTPPMPYMDM